MTNDQPQHRYFNENPPAHPPAYPPAANGPRVDWPTTGAGPVGTPGQWPGLAGAPHGTLPPTPPSALPPTPSSMGPPTWAATDPPPPAPSVSNQPMSNHRLRRAMLAGLGVLALVVSSGIAGGVVGSRLSGDRTAGTSAAAQTVSDRVQSAGVSSVNATAVLNKMKDSVVAIQAKVVSYDGPWSSEGTDAGTGIVIDNSGNILTNAHVVADAQSLTVTLPGSTKTRTATLVGENAAKDLAVIHVDDTSGLAAATLASADNAQVGEGVVAIGNALALQGSLTVTEGIVSAEGRSIQTVNSNLTGLLQTDAAISSGNSGGPLVDANGTVIGMNTAVASSSDQVQASNIGFAIPIRYAINQVSTWIHSK